MAAEGSPIAIQALIRAVEDRTRAEERTQAMLARISADFELLGELIRACDIPGLKTMVARLEAGMGVIVDYLSMRDQQDASRLGEYREMGRRKLDRGGGSITVGDIKANNVQVSGEDSLMALVENRPDVAALVTDIKAAKEKGKPFDDLLARLVQLAPDVAKVLITLLGRA